MNCLQKLLILGKARNDVERSNIEALFALLDKYGVEYYTLAISLIDLNLDNFFPIDAYKYVVEDPYFNKLIQLTVKFDVYIPVFKWVFNIHQTIQGKTGDSTKKMIEDAVAEKKDLSSLSDFLLSGPIYGPDGKAIEWAGKHLDSNKQVLEALICKFEREGLQYPGIGHGHNYGSLSMSNSDLTFDANNLESLEGFIKKK